METKVLVVFYSRTGNVRALAEAAAEGAKEVEGASVTLRRVDDLAPEEVIARNEVWAQARAEMKSLYPEPTLEDLAAADAVLMGSPTRYGNMAAELKLFVDKTGPLWVKGQLVNKVGSVFTSTSTPHGGQESTLLTMMIPFMHFGMILVPPGYADPLVYEAGSPYGATSVSGAASDQKPTEKDLAVARFQGKRVAEIAFILASAGVVRH